MDVVEILLVVTICLIVVACALFVGVMELELRRLRRNELQFGQQLRELLQDLAPAD